MRNILVLCIGNICRSPMAEAMLTKALPDCHVRSAGLGALIGSPADPSAIKLMEEDGININAHRAQQVSSELISWADLILVMDIEQKKQIESRYVAAHGKVFRLCEAERTNVPDPYRESIERFRFAHSMIGEGVRFWTTQITQIN